jgi:tetratricopeptide (TPR) repeat protein
MYNVLEVLTVKAPYRHRRAILGMLVGTLASGAFATLGAQQVLQRGQTAGPRFMVPTFKSSERNLGVQMAEAARERFMRDFNIREIWIVPKVDITNTLEASVYSTTEALNPNDARTLANQVRADEYLEGTITKNDAGGYTLNAEMKLTRGQGMVQPLPPITDNKLGDIASTLAKEVEAAREQMDGTKKCVDLSRQKKYAEALGEARKAIGEYAQATLARVCMAEIYYEQKLGADSMISVSEAILAIHPKNARALAFAADAYNEKGLDDKYIEALTTLMSVDPTNTSLQTRVVNALAASGKANLAKPIIDQAVEQNPGDPQLVHLQWLVYLALKDFKGAVAVGEELVKLDTARADTAFFTKLAAAYVSDSQPQKAAEAASRGIAKFPDNATLGLLQAQLLRTAGQSQQALEAIDRLLASNPKIENGYLQKAQIQVQLEAPADSIIPTLRNALANGTPAEQVGPYALTLGNGLYRHANAIKTDSAMTAVEEFRSSLKYIEFSDETAPSANSKLLLAAANVQMASALAGLAREQESCELAREGQEATSAAQMLLGAVGKDNPDTAKGLAGGVQQLMPYYDQLTKALCK